MQNLKNNIINKNETPKEQGKNYNKTQEYINNNLEQITDQQLENRRIIKRID